MYLSFANSEGICLFVSWNNRTAIKKTQWFNKTKTVRISMIY